MAGYRDEMACDFDQGVEALEYWRERRASLPWHRRAERREADVMIDRWERRVRRAVLRDASLSPALRLEGGLLAARTRARIVAHRWRRRLAIAGATFAGAVAAGVAALAGLL